MVNVEKNWLCYVEETQVNKRLQELKCFIDDLRCRNDLHLIDKDSLANYLYHNFQALSIKHVAKYLGSEFLISNNIDPVDCDENHLYEYIYQCDDKYRDFLSNRISPDNQCWDQWRKSQAQRYKTEDNSIRASKITYIPFAIELTTGCSGGCYFCGFSAPKLEANLLRYSQNHQIFKKLLREFASVAGMEYGKAGVLYWATDPLDHPDYPLYARDFVDVFGMYPHTTTAIAENKILLTKEIIDQQVKFGRRPWGIRCSLRSSNAYEKLRSNLSLKERSIVQMNPQYMGKQMSYARSGRALKHSTKTDQMLHGGTIACMTGFLVSLPENNIRLITPCLADEYNVNGYRVLTESNISSSITIRRTLLNALKLTDKPIMNDETLIKFNANYDTIKRYKTEEGLSIPSNMSSLHIPIKLLHNIFDGYAKKENIENLLFKMIRDGVAIVDC